jgi:hypothetical protein
MSTLTLTALVPSTFEATIWLIFITVPLEAALGSNTTEEVADGVK